MEMLSNGSSGNAVRALQAKLMAMGFNPGTIDGIFGSKTDQAVRRYQEQKGLQVDGIAGPETFTSLGMMKDENPAAAEVTHQPDPIEAAVAPERHPAEHENPAPRPFEAMRSTETAAEERADDKADAAVASGVEAMQDAMKATEKKVVGAAPKGLRAKLAARRDARRNRDS